jgi:hypothetical protein
LLSLVDQGIRGSQGQTVARTETARLVNLNGQALAKVASGKAFRQRGVTLLRVEGSRIVNLSGQHIATVEAGSEEERALLVAAFPLFIQ